MVLGDQQIETVHPIMTHEYSQYLAYETYMRHTATSGDNESSVDRRHETTINHKHKHNAHMTQDLMILVMLISDLSALSGS